ncbi:MAG: hypothetical protein ACRCTS_01100 [Fusobacteriaceae bacterium]
MELRVFKSGDKVQEFVNYALAIKKEISSYKFKEFLDINWWWLTVATMPNQVKRNIIRGIYDVEEIIDTQYRF